MCDSPFYFVKAAQLRVGGFRGERGFESLRASLLRNQYFSFWGSCGAADDVRGARSEVTPFSSL